MTIYRFYQRVFPALVITAAAFLLLLPLISNAGQTYSVDKTVQHLINHVALSDLAFIRNSEEYTGKEAAEHMQKKYEHFKSRINTPEDFIEMCATQSILSGKPYMVIDKQGGEIKTSEWLTTELLNYRTNAKDASQ